MIVKSLPHYARFECPNGTSTFSLHQRDELPKGEGIYVYFECENLDEKKERIRSHIGVDAEEVWEIIQNYLPELEENIQRVAQE